MHVPNQSLGFSFCPRCAPEPTGAPARVDHGTLPALRDQPERYTPGPSLAEVRLGQALMRGHRGAAVSALQTQLNRQLAASGLPPLATDGLFGPKTQMALMLYQFTCGLEPSGSLGPTTLACLHSVPASPDVPATPIGTESAPTEASEHAARILQVAEIAGLTGLQKAYVLATAKHESGMGRHMTELGGRNYFARYEGLADLGNTYAGDGERFKGRGYVQITGRRNYAYWSERLGIDLVAKPERAAEPDIAAQILVLGMRDGTFTGKRLSNYIGETKADFIGARKIVNGTDRAHHIAQLAQYTDRLS